MKTRTINLTQPFTIDLTHFFDKQLAKFDNNPKKLCKFFKDNFQLDSILLEDKRVIRDAIHNYIHVDYDVILSLINSSEFDGIQGIDLSKKQDSYFRDFIPVFVYERIPQESRQDIREYLSKLDLDFYDPLEIMLRDKNKYCGDSLMVVDYIKNEIKDYDDLICYKKTEDNIKNVLQEIAYGNLITINGFKLDRNLYYMSNYKLIANYLAEIENIETKIEKSPEAIKKLNEEYYQVFDLYKEKSLTLDESMVLTGLARRSFFRKLKEYSLKKAN